MDRQSQLNQRVFENEGLLYEIGKNLDYHGLNNLSQLNRRTRSLSRETLLSDLKKQNLATITKQVEDEVIELIINTLRANTDPILDKRNILGTYNFDVGSIVIYYVSADDYRIRYIDKSGPVEKLDRNSLIEMLQDVIYNQGLAWRFYDQESELFKFWESLSYEVSEGVPNTQGIIIKTVKVYIRNIINHMIQEEMRKDNRVLDVTELRHQRY